MNNTLFLFRITHFVPDVSIAKSLIILKMEYRISYTLSKTLEESEPLLSQVHVRSVRS